MLFKARAIKGNHQEFPDLHGLPVVTHHLPVRESGPSAWGARVELPAQCWWCWGKDDMWTQEYRDDHQWITDAGVTLYVIQTDDDGLMRCHEYITVDIDKVFSS